MKFILLLFCFLISTKFAIAQTDPVFLNESDNVSESFGTLYNSSGNSQLDNTLNTEYRSSKLFFGVNCAFYFYNDMKNNHGKNAVFSPKIDNSNCPDGTIVFGKFLLNIQLKIFNRNDSGGGVPSIFAHEMAHGKANQMDWEFGSGKSTKKDELFADYYAGVFIHYRQYMGLPDIQNSLTSFFRLGSYDFSNPDFHGTPNEKVNAVRAGFNFIQIFKTMYPGTLMTDNKL